MVSRHHAGFTVIELLIVSTILALITACALPSFADERDDARHDEVKAACHDIKVALERYAVDHNGNYPAYILGGDAAGWDPVTGNRAYLRSLELGNPIPRDPLLEGGYLTSYPRNPFIEPGEGLESVMSWTGRIPYSWYKVGGKIPEGTGLGDPRFGRDAEVMGNTLDDPRYLWRLQDETPSVTGLALSLFDGEQDLNLLASGASNPFYSMGGNPAAVLRGKPTPGKTVAGWWPGQFFYRSGGEFIFPQGFVLDAEDSAGFTKVGEFRYQRTNTYLLGGYGSTNQEGLDVVRLVSKNTGRAINNLDGFGCASNTNPGYYRPHPDFPGSGHYSGQDGEEGRVHLSIPEVMGGGDLQNNPYFPYLRPITRDWLYGAPDGYPDGVIITLVSGDHSF